MGGAYNQRINGLLPGEKYYIRAYATNAEGTAYGSSLRFETMIHEQAPSWSRAKKSMVGQGWWTSPWFGSFNLKDESGWLYHEQLAWAYAMPASGGGVWLWTQATGWAWTEEGIYPFLHSTISSPGFILWKVQGANPVLSLLRQSMATKNKKSARLK